MTYIKFQPSGLLEPYVSFYYIWEMDRSLRGPLEVRGQTNKNCVLVFNYGDRYRLFSRKNQDHFLTRTFLSGFSLSPFTLQLSGRVSMLGVVFKGFQFKNLFRLPP